MSLNRFAAAAALAAVTAAPLVAATPAVAFGVWSAPGYSVQVQLPGTVSSWPQVAQVPVFGGPREVARAPQVATDPQTAEIPGDAAEHAPTFVAPGVEENAAGQLQRTQ